MLKELARADTPSPNGRAGNYVPDGDVNKSPYAAALGAARMMNPHGTNQHVEASTDVSTLAERWSVSDKSIQRAARILREGSDMLVAADTIPPQCDAMTQMRDIQDHTIFLECSCGHVGRINPATMPPEFTLHRIKVAARCRKCGSTDLIYARIVFEIERTG